MTTEHSAATAPLLRMCEECKKSFVDKKSFNKHIRSKHAKIFTSTCEVCQRQFLSSSKRNIRKHMKTEHPTFPFHKCEICQKSFLRESTFYDHRIRHTKKIICHLCGKVFNCQGNLDKHNIRIHGTEEELWEKYFPNSEQPSGLGLNDFSILTSPWAQTFDDEQFFTETATTVGKVIFYLTWVLLHKHLYFSFLVLICNSVLYISYF